MVWLAGAYGRIRAELPLPGVLLEERLEAALDLLPVAWTCGGASGCPTAGSSRSAWRAARTGTFPIPARCAAPPVNDQARRPGSSTARSVLEVGTAMTEFHGIHPKPLREGYVPIDWSGLTPRCESVRVRAHTCDCVLTTYELCSAGGLAHIRRTVRSAKSARTSESPRLRTAEALRRGRTCSTAAPDEPGADRRLRRFTSMTSARHSSTAPSGPAAHQVDYRRRGCSRRYAVVSDENS